jgi:exopolysaccharide biosynthesis polyprenyl glycosylphosphotransferase
MLKQRAIAFRRVYIFLDLIVTSFSLVAATTVYNTLFLSDVPFLALLARFAPALYFVLPVWYFLFRINGMYESRRLDTISRVAWIAILSVGEGITLLILLSYFLKITNVSRLFVLLFGFINIALLVLLRIILKEFLHNLRSKGYNFRRILIVGTGKRARSVAKKLHAHPEWGMVVYGFLSQTPEEVGEQIDAAGVLGSLENLQEVISTNPIDEVHIALPLLNLDTITSLLEICEEQGIRTRVMMDLYSPTISQVHLEDFRGTPMLTFTASPMETWEMVVKETIDRVGAFVMILLLFPLFLFLSLCIKATSKGPVFFVQERVGLHKRRFFIYKFRTMVHNAEELRESLQDKNELSGPVFKIKDDPRCTFAGRLLRKTSLDELPQLINVLKGEMSFVGPRPPLPSEITQYESWHYRRLSMKPGISGLWQVSGRNTVDFEKWMKLDLQYIDNWSLKLDFIIILRTLPAVLLGRGAS